MTEKLSLPKQVNPDVNIWNFIGNNGAFQALEAQRRQTADHTHRQLQEEAPDSEQEPAKDLLQIVRYIASGDAESPIGLQEIERALKTTDKSEIDAQEARVANFLIERFKLPQSTSRAHTDTYQKVAAQHAEELAEQERNRLLLIIEGIKVRFTDYIRTSGAPRKNQLKALTHVNNSIDIISDLHAALEWQQEVKASRGIRQILRIAFDQDLTYKARSEAQTKFVTTLHGIGEIVASENQNGIMDELYGILNATEFWHRPNTHSKADQLHDRDVYALHSLHSGECIDWTDSGPLPQEPGHIVMRHAMPYREVNFQGKIIQVEVTSRYKEMPRAIAKGGIKNGAISDDSNGLRFIVRDESDIPSLMSKLVSSIRKSNNSFTYSKHGYTQNIFEEGFLADPQEGEPIFFSYTENTHNRATNSKRKVIQFDLIIDGKSIEVQVLTVKDHLNTKYNKEFFHEGYYVRKLFQNGDHEPLITRLFNDHYIAYLMDILQVDKSQRIRTLNDPQFGELMRSGAHRRILGTNKPTIAMTPLQVEWERIKAEVQFLLNLIRRPKVYSGLIDRKQLQDYLDLLSNPQVISGVNEIMQKLLR